MTVMVWRKEQEKKQDKVVITILSYAQWTYAVDADSDPGQATAAWVCRQLFHTCGILMQC